MDVEAPGRGPSKLGAFSAKNFLEYVDDGFFDGVILGTRKAADTLLVRIPKTSRRIPIRYEHLLAAVPIRRCLQCNRMTLIRRKLEDYERDGIDWQCDNCGDRVVDDA